MSTGEPRWTIAELGERVTAALADGAYEPPSNGQVRAVPDLRTIRYYTSLGLLDRPAAMRGRTALYGHRHLLQLVAVKRLQAGGKSLSEVQAALAGLDDGGLAAIAAVTVEAEEAASRHVVVEQGDDAPREARFWAASPARVAAGSASSASLRAAAPVAPASPVVIVAKVALAPGVSLLVEAAGGSGEPERIAGAIDAFDLVRAAAPLIEALRRQGLALGDEVEEEETE
jgi:DNA-binding transcriptional MerR regulator